jgi:hypothetical protein
MNTAHPSNAAPRERADNNAALQDRIARAMDRVANDPSNFQACPRRQSARRRNRPSRRHEAACRMTPETPKPSPAGTFNSAAKIANTRRILEWATVEDLAHCRASYATMDNDAARTIVRLCDAEFARA